MGMMEELILENSDACEVVRRSEATSEEEFREGRRIGLGGSDAGATMELSKYKSPFMVVCDKLGLVKKAGDTEATRRGKRREPWLRNILADWFQEETGVRLEVFRSPAMYRSKRHPFMLLNLDGFVKHPDLGLGNLEIKTANEFMMPDWVDDSVPDTYYAQGQHYNEGDGLPYTLFFAEVGDTFLYRIAPHNKAFVDRMLVAESNLWTNYIQPKILPEPMGLDAEDDYLMQLYGGSVSENIIQLPDMEPMATRYLFLNDQMKAFEAEKKEIQNILKARIGEAKGATLGAYRATWSRFKMERLDTEAFKVGEPALWQKYRKEVDSGRFTISAPKAVK